MDDDSYDGLILTPQEPILELEDYGTPKHDRLIALWKQHIVKFYVERLDLGRNDPCICSSGRKLKKCCAAPDPRLT